MDHETDFDDQCPRCGHFGINYRDCTNFHCHEGYEDEADDDPINFYPGESVLPCQQCKGTGVEQWCPSCGTDLSGFRPNYYWRYRIFRIRKFLILKLKRKK